MKKAIKIFVLVVIGFFATATPPDYPIDGYQNSGIRRLKRLQLTIAGDLPDPGLTPGAYRSIQAKGD